MCAHQMPDGQCQVTKRRCRLLAEAAPSRAAINQRRASGTEAAPAAQFVLCKGYRGWKLVFEGRESVLPDEKGVAYVAVLLLDPPRESMHGAELANRAFGDAVVDGQRNPGIDDRDTIRTLREARRNRQAVLDDAHATETERVEARAELDEIDAWARKHLRGTVRNEQR